MRFVSIASIAVTHEPLASLAQFAEPLLSRYTTCWRFSTSHYDGVRSPTQRHLSLAYKLHRYATTLLGAFVVFRYLLLTMLAMVCATMVVVSVMQVSETVRRVGGQRRVRRGGGVGTTTTITTTDAAAAAAHFLVAPSPPRPNPSRY
jgi:hypothetical protein